MDIELDQFQKDLLESVREMNESQALPIAEDRLLAQERFVPPMSSSATQSQNVSHKNEKMRQVTKRTTSKESESYRRRSHR